MTPNTKLSSVLGHGADAGESRPAWSTDRIPGQPGLYGETLSQKDKNSQREREENGVIRTDHTNGGCDVGVMTGGFIGMTVVIEAIAPRTEETVAN